MWLLFLALVILFEVIADVLSKQWSLTPRLSLLVGGISFYMAANIAWLWSLRNGAGLARGVAIFSVVGAIIALVIGYFFYKEPVGRLQITGIIFGILGLTLIFWNDIFR